MTVFASAVAYAWYEGHDVRLSNNVSPLLAVVVRVSYLFRLINAPLMMSYRSVSY